jgi:hypothetical protein
MPLWASVTLDLCWMSKYSVAFGVTLKDKVHFELDYVRRRTW